MKFFIVAARKRADKAGGSAALKVTSIGNNGRLHVSQAGQFSNSRLTTYHTPISLRAYVVNNHYKEPPAWLSRVACFLKCMALLFIDPRIFRNALCRIPPERNTKNNRGPVAGRRFYPAAPADFIHSARHIFQTVSGKNPG